jgi:hypothetical protein
LSKSATSFYLLEIVLMLKELKSRSANGPLQLPNSHEEQRSAADSLNLLLDGMPGAGSVIDDGWPLAHTSTQAHIERQRKLAAAKREIRSASRKSLLATLLEHGQEESAKLDLDNEDLGALRFAYLDLLDREIDKHAVPTASVPPAGCAFSSCSAHEGLKHVEEGSDVDIHLCDDHYKEAQQRVQESNPA